MRVAPLWGLACGVSFAGSLWTGDGGGAFVVALVWGLGSLFA